MYKANTNIRSLHVTNFMYFTILKFQLYTNKIHKIYKCYVSQHLKFFIILIRFAWNVARMVERRSVYRVLVGKPEGKRPLGRPRCIREDTIKIDFEEV